MSKSSLPSEELHLSAPPQYAPFDPSHGDRERFIFWFGALFSETHKLAKAQKKIWVQKELVYARHAKKHIVKNQTEELPPPPHTKPHTFMFYSPLKSQ